MGFPSPADDYIELSLDLNEHLIQRPTSTFFVRAGSNAMQGVGIFKNDLVVVDRSLSVLSGQVVLAVLDGEFLLRKLIKNQRGSFLCSTNQTEKPLSLKGRDLVVWGVATYVIHGLR